MTDEPTINQTSPLQINATYWAGRHKNSKQGGPPPKNSGKGGSGPRRERRSFLASLARKKRKAN